MSSLVIFLIALFFIMLLLVLFIMKWRKTDTSECKYRIYQLNAKFNNYEQSDKLQFPFNEVVNNNDIEIADSFKNANVIMFTDYSLYDQNFSKIPYKERCNYKVFAINGIDMLANKKILSDKLGHTDIVPISYSLDNNEMKQKLVQENYEGRTYILKRNVQRQDGLLITQDLNYIVNQAWIDNYVVAQELLQDPYLVNGRKINLRVYLLIVIRNNLCDWYIYNDGFIYYAPEYYKKGDLSTEVNITTGLKDRAIYKENPLTHQDLYKTMEINDSVKLQKNIRNGFAKIYDIYREDLVSLNKGSPGLKWCLYGCDIAPNYQLEVKLIECNKGASLDKKDDRDGVLKYGMIRDAFSVVNIISGHSDNFIKIN